MQDFFRYMKCDTIGRQPIRDVSSVSFVGTTLSKKGRIVENTQLNVEEHDILYIDREIRSRLSLKIDTINILKKDLEKLIWVSANGIDPSDRLESKRECMNIRRRIIDLENGFEIGYYVLRVNDMLEEYNSILCTIRSRSFMSIGASDNKHTESRRRLSDIELNYLRIAKEYIPIKGIVQSAKRLSCPGCCSYDLVQDDDCIIFTCKECGTVVETLDDTPSYNDTDRVNMSSRYRYTCRGHFIEAMNKYEGKQNTTIPQEVLITLNREMCNHSLTVSSVTKDHIYMFLSEKKLSGYYEDLNLVYYLLTKIQPPNIGEYRSTLLEMYDMIEDIYTEIKDPDRINFLNVYYILYKLLQLLNYRCKKDDFYILKTKTKLDEHDEKWGEIICKLQEKYPEVCMWRYIPTL